MTKGTDWKGSHYAVFSSLMALLPPRST